MSFTIYMKINLQICSRQCISWSWTNLL